MAFDYKKEYKEFYLPGKKPQIVEIPDMNFIAVRGKGDPNQEGGDYKRAIGLLYGIAFTIKWRSTDARDVSEDTAAGNVPVCRRMIWPGFIRL